MLESAVLFSVILAIVLRGSLPLANEASGWTKARHVCFLLFVVVIHAPSFRKLGWIIGHPGQIEGVLAVPVGILSAGQGLLVELGSVLVGVVAMVLAFKMARRSQWARAAFPYALPIVYMSFAMGVYRGFAKAAKEPQGVAGFAFCQSVCLALFGWLFVYMWFFYRSATTHCLFNAGEPPRATDAASRADDRDEG